MYSELIFDNVSEKLTVPADMGNPNKDQLGSTAWDNLIELCGRVCYDSLGSEHSRGSVDYHKHIIDVNHLSVQEHANLHIKFFNVDSLYELMATFVNRPGFYVDVDSNHGFVTANIRAIREWFNNSYPYMTSISDKVGHTLQDIAIRYAPLAMTGIEPSEDVFNAHLETPTLERETWASLYIHNVSRGLTHELVRHGDWTAISQRSTRFVDESDSKWCWHPLITKLVPISHPTDSPDLVDICDFKRESGKLYTKICDKIQLSLVDAGVERSVARKQSRGAARGILGNALETKLIFSASLTQWKHIILMRASKHADAEIRLWANEVFDILSKRFPGNFSGFVKSECPDGIGYHIEQKVA